MSESPTGDAVGGSSRTVLPGLRGCGGTGFGDSGTPTLRRSHPTSSPRYDPLRYDRVQRLPEPPLEVVSSD